MISFRWALDARSANVKYGAAGGLIHLHQRRTTIESKKQDLRYMVGERYRDLIDAADSITAMRTSALNIEGMFKKMSVECDASRLIARGSDEFKARSGGAANSASKKRLFSLAAHLKILVEIPELIHRALENNQYFVAARLYLIGRNIYRNLRHTPRGAEDGKQRILMSKFPVAQRQWDIVSHFKKEIAALSSTYLSVVEIPDEVVARTLGSLVLLDNATENDCLERLLAARRSAVESLMSSKCSLSNLVTSVPHLSDTVARAARRLPTEAKRKSFRVAGDKESQSDSEAQCGQESEVQAAALKLLAAMEIIVRTVKHVERVFMGRRGDMKASEDQPGHGLLAALIETLHKGISVHELVLGAHEGDDVTTNPRKSSHQAVLGSVDAVHKDKSPLAMSNSTNFHLLLRNLPERSQNFVPTLRTGGGDSSDATYVKKVMIHWIQAMTSIISGAAKIVLEQVAVHHSESGTENHARPCSKLAEVRAIVWDVLTSGEFDEDNEWNKVCDLVVGKHVPIYTMFLRRAFLESFKDAITGWLDEMVDSSTRDIRKICETLATQGSRKPNDEGNLAKFVWEYGLTPEDSMGVSYFAGDVDAFGLGAMDGSARLEASQRVISRCLQSEAEPIARVMRGFRFSIDRLEADARIAMKIGFFGGSPSNGVESGIGAVLRTDTEKLSEHLLEEFGRAMGSCSDWLSKATEEQEAAAAALDSQTTQDESTSELCEPGQVDQHINTVLLIAGLAKSLASECENGLRRLVFAIAQQKGHSIQKFGETMTTLRAEGSLIPDQTDGYIVDLRKKLLSLHIRSHDLWIQAVRARFGEGLHNILIPPRPNESEESLMGLRPMTIDDWLWGDACNILNNWEGVTLEDSTESSESASTTVQLPANVSTALANELWQVNCEVNRVSGCGLDKQIVRMLLDRLSDCALVAYGYFLDSRSAEASGAVPNSTAGEASSGSPLTDKGALQMLFDMNFLVKLLEPMTNKDAWLREVQRVKDQINPGDLVKYESLIMANVEKCYDRTATLYGSMAGIAHKPSIRKQPSVTRISNASFQLESHNVIGVAVPAPRFQTLPIGQLLPPASSPWSHTPPMSLQT